MHDHGQAVTSICTCWLLISLASHCAVQSLCHAAPDILLCILKVQTDSRGRKRSAGSDDALDWRRYQKYDIFRDLLSAAAASPAAQVLTLQL